MTAAQADQMIQILTVMSNAVMSIQTELSQECAVVRAIFELVAGLLCVAIVSHIAFAFSKRSA